MNRTRALTAVATASTLALTGVVIASSSTASATEQQGPTIVGAWRMTIDPAGPPPPFVSRIAFSEGGVVTDTVPQAPPVAGATSATPGLGAWSQKGRTVTFTFERFLSSAGVYVALQRVTGTATVSQDGQTQAGPATTAFFAPNGTPLGAPLSVEASGSRLNP